MQDLIARRDPDKFRRRVADAAQGARSEVHFTIGAQAFEVVRSLNDLSLVSWKLDGSTQVVDDLTYMQAVTDAMNVGAFSDVIIILNLIVFMWQGVRHEVVVEADGTLSWSGERYASLSHVARAITGTRWNGPRFFGLREGAQA